MKKAILTKTFCAGAFFLAAAGFFAGCKTVSAKNNNSLGDFSPREIGRVYGGTVKRTKNEIKPAEYVFVFYPRTNFVGMYHKFLGDNIWIGLSEENRRIIVEAMQKYIEAYKAKALHSRYDKKKAYFGKTEVSISWGVLGAGRIAKPVLRCEFQLLTENRPYFILGSATVPDEEGANSPAVRMAFSPAQCADIIEILQQENLVKIAEEMRTQFERYGFDEDSDVKTDVESGAKESSDEDTANYDGDF